MANYRLLSSFHSTLDNIVKERFTDTFNFSCDQPVQKVRSSPRTQSAENALPESENNLLTMGMIGCLPDNVQQAIKSFSIRRGKQHVTFAFPFMEDSVRAFCHSPCELGQHSKARQFTTGLFFDECLDVVHGFKTYITFVPHINRHSLPVVLLTLYQRGTTEGICCHFRSLFRILLDKRPSSFLWRLPTLVADLNGKIKEKILDTCAESILEFHLEFLMQALGHACKSNEELIVAVKERILRPHVVSYRELLRRNIQEVMKQLTTTDPAYFVSVLDLLQAPGCSVLDLKKVDMMFKNPCSEQIVKDFWQIWGHEQIAWTVFTAIGSPNSSAKGSNSLYSKLVGVGCEQTISVGPISHVPLKEGLQSVIKCLKSQETSCTAETTRRDLKARPCNCGICKVQFLAARSRKSGLQESPTIDNAGLSDGSAFSVPFHGKTFFLNERKNVTFTTSYPYAPIPYRHTRGICKAGACDADLERDRRNLYFSSISSVSETLVNPLTPYFKMNLKPTIHQPFAYGYSLSPAVNSK